ncbi:ribonuclease H-like domain-containing protein, partial [Tanacetum coccineum]
MLVPHPSYANVVGCSWLCRHRFNSVGHLERYKGCLVAQGFSQQPSLDFDETFSHMVKPATIRIVLSISSFTREIHDRSHMDLCKPCRTPTNSKSKFSSSKTPVFARSLVGALQYLTFTSLDFAYAVHQVFLFMHDPREPHLNALKCVLPYLQ